MHNSVHHELEGEAVGLAEAHEKVHHVNSDSSIGDIAGPCDWWEQCILCLVAKNIFVCFIPFQVCSWQLFQPIVVKVRAPIPLVYAGFLYNVLLNDTHRNSIMEVWYG
jgi:hypothetical protein